MNLLSHSSHSAVCLGHSILLFGFKAALLTLPNPSSTVQPAAPVLLPLQEWQQLIPVISSSPKVALGNGEVLIARAAASAKYLSKGGCFHTIPAPFFLRSHELIQEQEKQQTWLQPLQVSATLFFLFLPHPQCPHGYPRQQQIPRGSLGTS